MLGIRVLIITIVLSGDLKEPTHLLIRVVNAGVVDC